MVEIIHNDNSSSVNEGELLDLLANILIDIAESEEE